jgi:NAD(P)H-dependent FMN reductase
MAHTPRILAFAGSAREGSFNKMLVKIAATGARDAGAEVTSVDLRDFPMPIYDADLEAKSGIPEAALRLRALMKSHDGFLIASPENNSTISALLKNVIDWASRPIAGEARLACFDGKVAAICAASTGALGGIRGLIYLRSLLGHMRMIVIPDQKAISKAGDAFDPDGSLRNKGDQQALEALGASLARFIAKLRS